MEHLVGFPVDIDLEVAGAFHRYVVLAVNVDHGHLAQHVKECHRLSVSVLLHVVGHLIGGHLHDGFLRHHLYALQVEAVLDGLELKAVGAVSRSLGQSGDRGEREECDGKSLLAFDIVFHCLVFFWVGRCSAASY